MSWINGGGGGGGGGILIILIINSKGINDNERSIVKKYNFLYLSQ